MNVLLAVHVIGAALGLFSGLIALCTAKGSKIHRKSGIVFVGTMLVMCLSAIIIASARGESVNIVAGTLTAYLVATALTTVRPLPSAIRPAVERSLMVLAFTVGIAAILIGTQIGRSGAPLFPFGVMGILASVGDYKTLRAGTLPRVPRLARHLWRMCLAFWIATGSFFLGPRTRVEAVLPDALVTPGLLVLPVVAVTVALFYFLWRVKRRRGVMRIELGPYGASR
jgi:hypothetical protein